MLILSVAAPRTGSTRFGQLLQSMDSTFVREPFHPKAYVHRGKGPRGLRFYSKAPYTLSDFGKQMLADSAIQGMLPSRSLRMTVVPRLTARYLQELSNNIKEKENRKITQYLSILLEKTSAKLGPAYNLFREPRIARRVCELLDAMEYTYTLELFPGHLTRECHDFLCQKYSFILHQRVLIDSYISLIKTDFRRWNGVDTTERKVRICPESFLTYCHSISNYYLRTYRLGTDSGSGVINYEDWSDHPNQEQAGRVYQLLQHNGLSGAFQEPETSGGASSDEMARQDRSTDWSAKVTNGEEVIHFLKERSLEELLGARPLEIPALPGPLP
jgi:hypothetical protein